VHLNCKRERDEDLLRVCDAIRKSRPGYLSVAALAAEAVQHTACSFHLSERRYAEIIKKSGRPPVSPLKAAMHDDIRSAFQKLRESSPAIPERQLIQRMSTQEAPRFYLSQSSVMRIIYTSLKKSKPQQP
jgi:hypothetical protein